MPADPNLQAAPDRLTRALGEAVIRIWSNLPQEVQDHLFKEDFRAQSASEFSGLQPNSLRNGTENFLE